MGVRMLLLRVKRKLFQTNIRETLRSLELQLKFAVEVTKLVNLGVDVNVTAKVHTPPGLLA